MRLFNHMMLVCGCLYNKEKHAFEVSHFCQVQFVLLPPLKRKKTKREKNS